MAGATLGQLVEDYEEAARGFVDVLGRVGDVDAKVPHLEWTVADTAAHVITANRAYEVMLRGGDPPWADVNDGAASNARNLATWADRTGDGLAGGLRDI